MKNNWIWAAALGAGLTLALGIPLVMLWIGPRGGYWPGHMNGWSMPMMGGGMMWLGFLYMGLTSLGTVVLIGAVIALLIKLTSTKPSSDEPRGFKA